MDSIRLGCHGVAMSGPMDAPPPHGGTSAADRASAHEIKQTRYALWGVVVGVIALAVTVINGDRLVPAAVCRSDAGAPFAALGACTGTERVVTEAQATEFLDQWFAEAGSASPEDAYALMVGRITKQVSREGFIAFWRPVLWAERTAGPTAIEGEFNTFRVGFHQYVGDGITDDADPTVGTLVTYANEKMTLIWTDDGVRLRNYEIDKDEEPPVEVHYPLLVVKEGVGDVVARRLPSVLAKNTGLTDWNSTSSTTSMMCYTSVEGDVEEYWLRSRNGWVPSSKMQRAVEDDPPAEDVDGVRRPCEPQHAVRAQRLNETACLPDKDWLDFWCAPKTEQ